MCKKSSRILKKGQELIKKRRYRSKKAIFQTKILAMLGFFSTSVGLWENFRQLWLQDNGFSATEVGNITSVATFISVGGIILVGLFVRAAKLKTFMSGVIALKILALIFLRGLDLTSQRFLIDICVIIDVLTTYLIITSIYPLMTTVTKSNRIYSKRKLVEYFGRDLGVLVGGIMIGQHAWMVFANYTATLLVSIIFLVIALVLMYDIDVTQTSSFEEPRRRHALFRSVFRDKIQRFYLTYSFLAAMSFATALGLKMLVLTNYLNFSASTATNYLLIIGLLSDVVGWLALKFFTPKNDYITIFLKFGIRLIAYIIAIFAESPFVFLMAITWSILISTAYEDVTDGYYINLVDNRHQFSYSTVKHVMSYLGEASGIMLCGWTYAFGIGVMIGSSAVIMVIQIIIACYLISIRHGRHRFRHSASRARYDESLVDPD